MSDTYDARDQAAEGTQASPALLNKVVGNPKMRSHNADFTTGGQAAVDQVSGDGGAPSWASSNDRPNE